MEISFSDYTSYSFVLIKPDAYDNSNLNNDLNDYLSLYDLDIVNTYNITINEFHLENLWPIYQQCNLTRLFIEKYLLNNSCKVILLYGNDALNKVGIIKKEIRKKYSRGFFSNCIHAPANILENEVDLNLLINNICCKKKKYQEMQGLWGRVSNSTENELKDTIDRIWKYKELYGWDKIFAYIIENKNNDSCTYIKIFDDKDHTIDYIVSAIYETFYDEMSIEKVIICVLEIARIGEITIKINNNQTTSKLNYLNTLGVKSILI